VVRQLERERRRVTEGQKELPRRRIVGYHRVVVQRHG